jgi:hypothetical protein
MADARWPDARDEVVEIAATTTPAQRLEWLDEMLDLAYASGGLDKARAIDQAERRAAFATPASVE